VFTWSASGQIITESLSSTFPTCLAYVVDTPRTTNPTTFMSNMLYACSILYRTRLPMVIAFNKSDVTPPDFAAGSKLFVTYIHTVHVHKYTHMCNSLEHVHVNAHDTNMYQVLYC
jgi:Conserved hypothetical ATP binding protein